jgi:flagellar biosynthesis/type III secretory pathway chaperone
MSEDKIMGSTIQDKLRDEMQREIALMRELLGSLQQEQQALVTCDPIHLQAVMQGREALLEAMGQARNARLDTLIALAQEQGRPIHTVDDLDEESCHAILEQSADEECIEIITLRDQMLALLEAMNTHTQRNNNLLDAKIQTTRELIQHLHPDDPNRTYGRSGQEKKSQTTTVAVINQEA